MAFARRSGRAAVQGLLPSRRSVRAVGLNDIHPMRRGGVKSIADDFVLGRGVVISRAATSLRSVETQPLTRRFVRNRRTHLRHWSRAEGRSLFSMLNPTKLALTSACRFDPCPGLQNQLFSFLE